MFKNATAKKGAGVLLACALGGCAALSLGLFHTGTEAFAAESDHGTHEGWEQLTNATLDITGGTEDSPAKYFLNEDVTIIEDNLVIVSGYVELCLSGHVLHGDDGDKYNNVDGVIKVSEGATLTLCDCDTTTQHYYTLTQFDAEATNANYAYVFDNVTADTSKTYVSGGLITGGKQGVSVLGTFIMEGGTIAGNTGAGSGGGVYVDTAAQFTMNGGAIAGNAVTSNGGGVYVVKNAQFTMNGGAIRENFASEKGAGVYVTNFNGVDTLDAATFTMNEGEICNNRAWRKVGGNDLGNAGGVSLSSGAVFNMNDGKIADNQAPNDRNIEARNPSIFTMKGGSILDSYATEQDDVPSITAYATVSLEGGTTRGYIYRGSSQFQITGGYHTLTKFRPGNNFWQGDAGIKGGYFSSNLAEVLNEPVSGDEAKPISDYIPSESHQLVDLAAGEGYGDADYNTEYPYAVYQKSAATYTVADLTATYGSTLAPVITGNGHNAAVTYSHVAQAEAGTEGVTSTEGLPTNVGTYTVTATFAETPDGANKKVHQVGTATFTVTLEKAAAPVRPDATIEIEAGKTLSEIALPTGWAWQDATVDVSKAGEYTLTAVYTPADAANYNSETMQVKLVVEDVTPPAAENPDSLPGWAIALIVIGCVLVVGGAGAAGYFFWFKKRKKAE